MSERSWSRDWAKLDLYEIGRKLDEHNANPEAHIDIGITEEELYEYVEWLGENDIGSYIGVKILMQMLQNEGLNLPTSLDELLFGKS